MSSRNVEHVNSHQHKFIATYTVDNGRPNCELEIRYCNGNTLSTVPLLTPHDLTPGLPSPVPGITEPDKAATSKAEEPMLLSILFPPIPGKLVNKIRDGSFVDMRDMLPDNMALLRQLDDVKSDKAASKAKLREVNSLPSWLYCFMAYMAVQTSDPHTRELLTYARLIIREALRVGGDGFLTYDRLFREHAAIDKGRTLNWSTLEPGLHQATFIRQAGDNGMTCTLCKESDHPTRDCALASLKDKRESSPPPAKRSRYSRFQRPDYRQRQETRDHICISWNRGRCIFAPNCRMSHICATRQKADHRAKDCELTPDDSAYKFSSKPRDKSKA